MLRVYIVIPRATMKCIRQKIQQKIQCTPNELFKKFMCLCRKAMNKETTPPLKKRVQTESKQQYRRPKLGLSVNLLNFNG